VRDLAFFALALIFFLVSGLYARGCRRL